MDHNKKRDERKVRHHPNCRCVLLEVPEPPPNENWCKFAASILLCDISKKIVIPTKEEWYGLNMLERDDELRRMK